MSLESGAVVFYLFFYQIELYTLEIIFCNVKLHNVGDSAATGRPLSLTIAKFSDIIKE